MGFARRWVCRDRCVGFWPAGTGKGVEAEEEQLVLLDFNTFPTGSTFSSHKVFVAFLLRCWRSPGGRGEAAAGVDHLGHTAASSRPVLTQLQSCRVLSSSKCHRRWGVCLPRATPVAPLFWLGSPGSSLPRKTRVVSCRASAHGRAMGELQCGPHQPYSGLCSPSLTSGFCQSPGVPRNRAGSLGLGGG